MNAVEQPIQGVVVKWDQAKGFGFIQSPGLADAFFHARVVEPWTYTPEEGSRVLFVLGLERDGRRAATKVMPMTVTASTGR